MRWFGGCAPEGPQLAPEGARVLWSEPRLWMVGKWPTPLIRMAKSRTALLAVIGPCAATQQDLAPALTAPDLAKAVGHWPGSYTAVRFTARAVVEIVTDPTGACPLYTAHTPHGIVWGSSARALAPLTGGEVDTDWLAAYLWDTAAPRDDRSPWEGVRPVPPGHVLTLAAGGSRFLQPWWSSPTPRPRTEALRGLRHALTEGVRARVEDTPSATDLGGMDSTTLAVIAARHRPLTAITAYPLGHTEGGDLDYARALRVPGLTKIEFPLEAAHLPFAPAITPMPATDEPPPSTAVWAMLSAQLRLAKAQGTVRQLTGDGGDHLFLASPRHLVDLAHDRRWLPLMRDALAWARLRRQAPGPLITAALRGDTEGIARPWLARPPWLTPDTPEPRWRSGNATQALISSMRTVARTAHADAQLCDDVGIELHNPYLDGAVLTAVAAAPAEARFSAHRYKPLLVDAVGDLLPALHRDRATKGTFTSSFHHGLRANLRRVLDLTDGQLAARGLINPAPLRTTIHAAAMGAETNWARLLPTLAAEQWLATIDRTSAVRWHDTTPAPAGRR
ncbi:MULTISPECIES: albusnodin/ikarugamycin family macrolactam cyclase [unclassified Streptomyces]|uniref:albusnodin/ikarugamycin family macrolactam cyclase n=1 Tax=unclassified Streptomyces TaxID=2593676 RepID=UPI001EF0E4C2|nr:MULTISPECIES: albusnodin/ikarugamycin family macrolactam cyclase [unclassified Streptomyces]